MKMKKLTTVLALAAITFSASAQSLNVSSAFQDMKRGYLNKAKDEIDKACQHPDTKEDAKTWCYKGLIYTRIGGEAENKKSKFKNLAPDWAEQAYDAALECKRLDTKNEYAETNNSVFGFVGNEYYNRARSAYEQKNYTDAMAMAEKSIEMFNNAGQGQYAADATFIAGLSASANRDTANIKKYFNNLMRKRTDKDYVYNSLFNIYKAEGNIDQAMKVASNYRKSAKNNYKAYLLEAEGYLLNKNMEKGKEVINQALELTKDSVEIYPDLLAASAVLLESTGDFDGAEAKYNESLTLKPTQFTANYNMGKMFYNRAVDKLTAANDVPPEDETGLYDKLIEESKTLFRQSIVFLEKSVQYIDNITNADEQAAQKPNLANALNALGTAYARVEMYDESKAAKARVQSLMN